MIEMVIKDLSWEGLKSKVWKVFLWVLDYMLWIFWGDAASFLRPGQSADCPLETMAVPGITSLLDIALFRSVEAELTGTIHASHSLLQAWLDIQKHARRVLRFAKQQKWWNPNSNNNNNSNNENSMILLIQLESFARSCYDASCDVLERMSTDRFAETANLADAFDTVANNNHNNKSDARTPLADENSPQQQQQQDNDWILSALLESSSDTGRRRLPVPQRPRDCWESARLFCPDYVWGDDVAAMCQKTVRHLLKHPFCSLAFTTEWINASPSLDDILATAIALVDTTLQYHPPATGTAVFSFLTNTLAREQATLLMQLVFVDVPTRLTLFKAALDAESVVSKRLYLVKTEYRAPLRAFWEAHSSVQKAPTLELVQESLSKLATSSSSSPSATSTANKDKRSTNKAQDDPKENLQKLMENPDLVKLLAMERQMEQYELDMALALYPFCELARFLDQKKAIPKQGDYNLRETLARLKNILVLSSASSARQPPKSGSADLLLSAGIRPVLLDLQGVPRDDEEDFRTEQHYLGDLEFLKSEKMLAAMDARLDEFISQLKLLAKLCDEKQKQKAFYCDRKTEIDPPMAAECAKFDGQLFQCHFKDWYHLALEQYELTTATTIVDSETNHQVLVKIDVLAEQIRHAEMAVSLSMVSSEPALRKVQERVQVITTDRTKRFDILKECLQDLCLREMNWHLRLTAPPPSLVLELPTTEHSQIPVLNGFFGIPLIRAQQILPLG